MSDGLQASIEKMEREGVPGPAIATFEHYYEQLAAGESRVIEVAYAPTSPGLWGGAGPDFVIAKAADTIARHGTLSSSINSSVLDGWTDSQAAARFTG